MSNMHEQIVEHVEQNDPDRTDKVEYDSGGSDDFEVWEFEVGDAYIHVSKCPNAIKTWLVSINESGDFGDDPIGSMSDNLKSAAKTQMMEQGYPVTLNCTVA